MFSSIHSVNILTSLLLAHGVRHAVTCPGSRNAPICHNLNEACITCHPLTDERSAAFFAIGLSQALHLQPVALCVTSGSAILDTSPAVAEAYYQGIPIIIISADRPSAWIGQLDGQTMPQHSALGATVRKAVSLPEGDSDEDHWHINRLINEALLAATATAKGPALINVPLHEPLYDFHVAKLHAERVCHLEQSQGDDVARRIADKMLSAQRPMIVIGQMAEPLTGLKDIRLEWPILFEPLANQKVGSCFPNEMVYALNRNNKVAQIADAGSFVPDTILYLGGHIVSKELKRHLRSCRKAESIIINTDGQLTDVFMNATTIATCSPQAVIDNIRPNIKELNGDYMSWWTSLYRLAELACREVAPAAPYSQLQVLAHLTPLAKKFDIHYANSSSIRLGCITYNNWRDKSARCLCNRGINGIDGSLSTAAGYSLANTSRNTLCVIGDLSFFYDENALWNSNLNGHFRILLLNNHGGGIFGRFTGLKDSPARDRIVMATHNISAQGVCSQFGIEYQSAHDLNSLLDTANWLLADNANSPRLLEVFTSADADQQALDFFYNQLASIS